MTSSWAVKPLAAHSWDPTSALPELLSAFPPGFTGQSAPLSDLGEIVPPIHVASQQGPWVTPSGVDAVTGAIARLAPSKGPEAYAVGHGCLDIGDVMVPVSPRTPAVMIAEAHRPFRFSTRFIAVRVGTEIDPKLVWSVLNSLSGQLVRDRLGSGSFVRSITPREVLRISVPFLASSTLERIRGLLQAACAVKLDVGSAPRSSWRTVRLTDASSWGSALTGADDSEPSEGEPLGSVAEVARSPGVRASEHLVAHLPETHPIWRATDVSRGAGPGAWVPTGLRELDVEAGDVLVTQMGPRHRIVVADQPAVLGSNVLRIRCSDIETAYRLAAYLASPAGQRRLARLESGSTMPSVSLTSMRSLLIPWPLPSMGGSFLPEDRRLLSEKLEEALWT